MNNDCHCGHSSALHSCYRDVCLIADCGCTKDTSVPVNPQSYEAWRERVILGLKSSSSSAKKD